MFTVLEVDCLIFSLHILIEMGYQDCVHLSAVKKGSVHGYT